MSSRRDSATLGPDESDADYLTHYYERTRGPFRSLSDVSASESGGPSTCPQTGRRNLRRQAGRYLPPDSAGTGTVGATSIHRTGRSPDPADALDHGVLGSCNWSYSWYVETRVANRHTRRLIRTALASPTATCSAIRYADGKPCRGQGTGSRKWKGSSRATDYPREESGRGDWAPYTSRLKSGRMTR